MTRFTCLTVTAAAIFGLGVFNQLQSQSPPEQQTPIFRAGTKLVEVDVIAKARDVPATGLTKEDFALLDNGKPQAIEVFSVKGTQTSRSAAELAAANSSAPPPLPPGTFSNRITPESEDLKTTVLLVDQRNTPYNSQLYAIQRTAKFLAAPRARDRIALYTFGRDGLRAIQDLTSDSELLRQGANAIQAKDPGALCDGLEGRASESCTRQEILGRVMDTKHALIAIARHLAQVPGRKTLVWVTASITIHGKDFDFTSDMEEAARALNNSNLALYAVDARGLIGALSGMTGIQNAESRGNANAAQAAAMKLGIGPSGIETMNLLTGRTGGEAYYNTNGLEDSMQAAVDDGELTYTLGFYPGDAVPDGQWHNLKVEVTRPGVTVHFRKSYFAARTEDLASVRPTIEQLVKDPLDATQLELFAETTPDPARKGFLQVKVSVDPHSLEWRHENAQRFGGIDVAFFIEGSTQVQTKTQTFNNIPDNQFVSFLRRGLSVSESVDTTGPGRTLRVVVQDQTTGTAGSVTIPLPKTSKPSAKQKK